jgi:hypothetical protein
MANKITIFLGDFGMCIILDRLPFIGQEKKTINVTA